MTNSNVKLAKLEEKKNELERKQKELNAKIRAIRSKELNKKRKEQTHYKILLGAYLAYSVAERGEIHSQTIEGIKRFIGDDKKTAQVIEFLRSEIEKQKR